MKALKIAVAVASAIAAVFVGLPAAIGAMVAWNSTDAGHIAVVRNGGAFSDSNIRRIIDPASGLTWSGIWSTTHVYPAQQRFYTISANPGEGDRTGVDVAVTPSSDGVDMGLEGTLYFQLNLNHDVLSAFDNAYGTRTYSEDGKSLHAYDGDQGWSIFLDQIFRPVLDNDLRQEISKFSCAQLVSSCALVQNSTEVAAAKTGRSDNAGNIAAVQNAINASLASDLHSALGGDYFTGLRFNISRITLPTNIQNAVNDAQAAYAKVSQTQAEVAQAQAQAAANEARQQGYINCPACAEIDELKAIPPNVTTFAPGAGFAITPKQ
jgi:regulator of protease activity HflC (stomatin/prohibitin superfamily)